MVVFPSSRAPVRGLPILGSSTHRTGALLGGNTARGNLGRFRWFVDTAIIFCLWACVLAEEEQEWLRRPDTMTVCEGVTAHFVWDYSTTFGAVEAVFVSKLPGYVVLIEKLGLSDPRPIMNRTSLLVNGHFEFKLQNVTKADEGIYNLEVLFDETGAIHDKATLRVMDNAGCPDQQRYTNPLVYEVDANRSYVYYSDNRTFILSKPGQIRLGIIIPAADPQVTAQLSTAKNNCSCVGEKYQNSYCECDFYVNRDEVQEVHIRMKFIAYAVSLTRVTIGTKGTVIPNEKGNISISEDASHSTSPSVYAWPLLIGSIIILAVFLVCTMVVLVYRKWKSREIYQKDISSIDVDDAASGLLVQEKKTKITLLRNAITEGNLEAVKQMCENDADLEAVDPMGRAPLGLAALDGHIEIVKLLMQRGAAVNYPGESGLPPISGAAREGHVQLIEILCEKNADLHSFDIDGQTPLHCAARKGNIDSIQLLIERHADVNGINKHGQTPLGVASKYGIFDVIRFLVGKKADVNLPGGAGKPPLHCAARKDNVGIVLLLLDYGADINCVNEYGQTPLGAAARKGQINAMKSLIDRGADINCPRENGRSPLHCASEKGHAEVIRLLLGHKADVRIRNKFGKRPHEVAASIGHSLAAELLMRKLGDTTDTVLTV